MTTRLAQLLGRLLSGSGRRVFHCIDYAPATSALNEHYDEVWSGFPKAELP